VVIQDHLDQVVAQDLLGSQDSLVLLDHLVNLVL
jgi:hypothetical protein